MRYANEVEAAVVTVSTAAVFGMVLCERGGGGGGGDVSDMRKKYMG